MAIFICGAIMLLVTVILLCFLVEDNGVWSAMLPTLIGLTLMSGAYFFKSDVTVEEQISRNNKKIERLIQENGRLESLKGDK